MRGRGWPNYVPQFLARVGGVGLRGWVGVSGFGLRVVGGWGWGWARVGGCWGGWGRFWVL